MLSYLMLSVDDKMQKNVRDTLLAIECTVDKVEERNGEYNLMARIVIDGKKALRDFVSEQVGSIGGIRKVETIIV